VSTDCGVSVEIEKLADISKEEKRVPMKKKKPKAGAKEEASSGNVRPCSMWTD
jgi:hypothetical protein